MFNKLINFIILVSLSLSPQLCWGGGPRIMTVPKKYLRGPSEVLPKLKNKSDYDPKTWWIVCSDRVNNPTFKDAEGHVPFKQMDYMDMFYVIDENDRFLHLYRYAENITDAGSQIKSFSPDYDYGWVEKTKLLLWSRCMVNDKQLGEKALPIITINTLNKDMANYIKSGSGTLKLFSDPSLSHVNDKSMDMFQFLFVYKSDGGSLLLGKAYQSGYYTIKEDVMGWVSSDIVQLWADRVCLEPNTNEEASRDRKAADLKASLFGSKDDVLSWKTGGAPKAIWDDDQYGVPFGPYTKRFPILKNDVNGIVYSGKVTDIIDKSGNPLVLKRRHDSLDQELNKQLTNIRAVNTIFVIDAGSGLSEYVSSVATAIQKIADDQANRLALNNTSGDNNNNVYKYGAVVYRDFMDVACGTNDYSIDKFDLTSNNIPALVDWLNKQSKIQGCKQGNKALNLGLSQALRMISQNNTDQSNFIVLVGGEIGKPNPKYTDDAITKQLGATKTSLLAFQVQHGQSMDFDIFDKRVKDMISNANKIAVANTSTGAEGKIKTGDAPIFSAFGDNSYIADYPTNSELQGILTYTTKGGQLPTDSIISQVDRLLNFTADDINRKVSALESYFDGLGKKDIKLDASLRRYIVSLGKELNDMALVSKYVNNDAYQFFITGYTTDKIDKLSQPVFKRVLYLHFQELNELIAALNPLTFPGSTSDARDKITDAFITIIKTYIGDQDIKNLVNKMTAQEVTALITGIPSTNPFLKHSIADFKKESVVPDDEIRRLVKYMVLKIHDLESVRSNPQLTQDYQWGIYYWVSEDLLP